MSPALCQLSYAVKEEQKNSLNLGATPFCIKGSYSIDPQSYAAKIATAISALRSGGGIRTARPPENESGELPLLYSASRRVQTGSRPARLVSPSVPREADIFNNTEL